MQCWSGNRGGQTTDGSLRGTSFAAPRRMNLFELLTAMVATALLGAGVGLLVAWAVAWPLLVSAGAGAGIALAVGGIFFSIAIVLGEARR